MHNNKSDNNNKCKQCANINEEKNTVCLGASWKKPDEIRFKAQNATKHCIHIDTDDMQTHSYTETEDEIQQS